VRIAVFCSKLIYELFTFSLDDHNDTYTVTSKNSHDSALPLMTCTVIVLAVVWQPAAMIIFLLESAEVHRIVENGSYSDNAVRCANNNKEDDKPHEEQYNTLCRMLIL